MCHQSPALSPQSTIDQILAERLTTFDDLTNLQNNGRAKTVLKGVTFIYNFLSEDEEAFLIDEIDKAEWIPSQSGRRKQVYFTNMSCEN
jgi:hypothetical protein